MSSDRGAAGAAQFLRSDVHRGTVALVTGGGTGIGRAVALDLVRCGAHVVLAGRREEPLRMTATMAEDLGGQALVVPTDIRDEAQVSRLVDRSLDRFGRLDHLINNAGGQFSAPAEEISTKGWRAVHRLAVEGTWSVTREVAARAMIPQRSGVIIFIGFSPRRGIASMVHATTARAALENLASGLSLEWSRYSIRTLCVAPGTIATEGLVDNYSDLEREGWAAAVPLGRLGTPDDVSTLITFLTSPAASYITGTTIAVDGGVDAWGAGHPAPTV